MSKHKNILYIFTQIFFWMVYCSCYGFESYYLVEKGFGTSVVGILTAIAGIISAVGQPFVGAIADKAGVGYKKPLMTILSGLSIFGIVLIAFSSANYEIGICLVYAVIMLLLGMATPLVNAAGVAFPDEVNFGMARGLGSFGYALASYVLGYMSAAWGAVVIPVSITIVSILMLIVDLFLPNSAPQIDMSGDKPVEEINNISLTGDNKEINNISLSEDSKNINNISLVGNKKKSFLRSYPQFAFLWIVLIFMLTVHSLSNTYLLQILEKGGGDSHNLGIAVAIAAIMEIPMIFYFEKINKWINTQNLLIIAAITYFAKSVLQLVNSNLIVFYFIQILQLCSWGIYASASVYYAREVIPQKDQTKAQAYMANALTIGTVIGTFIGGLLIEKRDVNAMLMFQTAVGAIGVVGILIWKRKSALN